MYFVYLLQSRTHSNKTGVGFTEDLKKRMTAHNTGQSPYTSKFKPWKLVTYIAFEDRQKALSFEKYLKTHSGSAFAKKILW